MKQNAVLLSQLREILREDTRRAAHLAQQVGVHNAQRGNQVKYRYFLKE